MLTPKTPVYLNIYDFTTLNTCLKIIGLPGYHTGIQINNMEYCFCVIDSNPLVTGLITIEPQSAEYRFNRKLYLGETSLSEYQLEQIIDNLSKKYTCGRYNMFTNNCNHFCDELARMVLGTGIPRWIFSTTDCLKYVCCCLPEGFVSGLWAIQSIEEEQVREEAALLRPYKK